MEGKRKKRFIHKLFVIFVVIGAMFITGCAILPSPQRNRVQSGEKETLLGEKETVKKRRPSGPERSREEKLFTSVGVSSKATVVAASEDLKAAAYARISAFAPSAKESHGTNTVSKASPAVYQARAAGSLGLKPLHSISMGSPVEGRSVKRKDEEEGIPLAYNRWVSFFIRYFQNGARSYFSRWLERSTRYLPRLQGILEREGLPKDLAYLALIESGFNPFAYSKSRAAGLWQFMPSTARKYGLRIDWWVDERRDPEKATVAAARYLKDLYRQFGSWWLAIAAYNGGEGALSRAIRRYKTKDIWKIIRHRYLKPETRNFVPKFLAALMIAKDPEKYGFTGLSFDPSMEYEKIRLEYATDLRIIADGAGTTIERLRELNPELRRRATPPYLADYEIRIPKGTRARLSDYLAGLNKRRRVVYKDHRVRPGESLWIIARRYGITVGAILSMNKLEDPSRIWPGQRLVIPAAFPFYAQKAGVQSGGSEETQLADVHEQAKEELQKEILYRVQKGDTLWGIARRYRLSISEIRRWNDIGQDHIIRPGDKLVLRLGNM